MKKIVINSLFLVIILAGCSSGTQRKQGQIRLALDWSINANHIGIFAAINQGYYKEEGLNVEIIPLGKIGTLPLLLQGYVDLALSSQGEIIFAQTTSDAHTHLKSIATLVQHNPNGLYSLAQKNISIPRDLQNKIYGGWGSPLEEEIINTLITETGIEIPSIKNNFIGNMNIIPALQAVDFIWGYQAIQGVFLDTQAIDYNFIPIAQYIPALDDYSPMIIMNDKKSDKIFIEDVKKFLKATGRGYKWTLNHSQQAKNILTQYDETLSPDTVEKSLAILSPLFLNEQQEWGKQEETRYSAYIDFLYSHNLISDYVDPTTVFTNELL